MTEVVEEKACRGENITVFSSHKTLKAAKLRAKKIPDSFIMHVPESSMNNEIWHTAVHDSKLTRSR